MSEYGEGQPHKPESRQLPTNEVNKLSKPLLRKFKEYFSTTEDKVWKSYGAFADPQEAYMTNDFQYFLQHSSHGHYVTIHKVTDFEDNSTLTDSASIEENNINYNSIKEVPGKNPETLINEENTVEANNMIDAFIDSLPH